MDEQHQNALIRALSAPPPVDQGPPQQPYTPTPPSKWQAALQAVLMGGVDTVMGAIGMPIGDSKASQFGELLSAGLPMMGGMKALRGAKSNGFQRIAAGDSLGPYAAGSDVANTDSIASSLAHGYQVEPGIQSVPLTEFYGGTRPTKPMYAAADDVEKTYKLADQIKQSGRMDPLIVVRDKEGLYVLEGGHRLDASYQLGGTHIPAIVVNDAEIVGSAKVAAKASGVK